MLRRLWQKAMIGLARSSRASRFMHRNRTASSLAERYVAGSDARQAAEAAAVLMAEESIRSSLFYLGEYVTAPDLVRKNVSGKLAAVWALATTELDIHISVDPTQIGYAIDSALARDNARRIAEVIVRAAETRPGVHCLMLDMEDESVVDYTIGVHDELKRSGLPVGLTLQAYLRRTASDLRAQIEAGSRVRLVKGAFAAPADIAYTRRRTIRENFLTLVEMMLSRSARDGGFYPIIATHDERIHQFAIETARRNGWAPQDYEFELLLGVRPDVARSLAARGLRVRLYVPFGSAWWPYAARRIGENPRNAVLLLRSVFGGAS